MGCVVVGVGFVALMAFSPRDIGTVGVIVTVVVTLMVGRLAIKSWRLGQAKQRVAEARERHGDH